MNRKLLICILVLIPLSLCTSQEKNLDDTFTLSLKSEQSEVIMDGKVAVTYHSKQGYEPWSTLSFTGIEGISDEPEGPFQNHNVSISRGKVFYFKVITDTLYRVQVVREFSNVVTLEISRLVYSVASFDQDNPDTTSTKKKNPESKRLYPFKVFLGISFPTSEFASQSDLTGGYATTGPAIGFEGGAFVKYFEIGLGGSFSSSS